MQQFGLTFVLAILTVIIYPGAAIAGRSAVSTQFLAKVRVQSCPEHLSGQASLIFSYRAGSASEVLVAPLREEVDHRSGQAVASFYLPRTFAATPLEVRARCFNNDGFSRPSNPIKVSNCDFLQFEDSDADGLSNGTEDTNCDNFFSYGDLSNPHNADTDGDSTLDLAEFFAGTDRAHAGSADRAFIVSGGKFDPDADGNSNPVVWRPYNGTWYIRDFTAPETHLGVQFGLPGDVPFSYQPVGAPSNVGTVRSVGPNFMWLFNGPGIPVASGLPVAFWFGSFGDMIIPGAWEQPGISNAAVARLFNDQWWFYILQHDGAIRPTVWGVGGDIPRIQDYDGDGILDVAVYRPNEETTYVIRSRDGLGGVYPFGAGGSVDVSPRGDVSGDGLDDLIFWEPRHGMFTAALSDTGFSTSQSMQLGLYFTHRPLSWNFQNGKALFTVVDHATGTRYVRPDNDASASPVGQQWGLARDFQG